ncbi:MAG: hypothetical protein SGARI_001207 [Bacillariaceae sp.]
MYLQDEGSATDCQPEYDENDENKNIVPEDKAVAVDETPKKISRKKTPKKKSSSKKKKPPKQKKDKVEIDPSFVVTPRTAAKHNAKTPVMSNKGSGNYSNWSRGRSSRSASKHSAETPVMSNKGYGYSTATRRPSSVSFTTSSSHITGSLGFDPLTMAGTLPPSFFHFPLPPLPRASTVPVASAVQRTVPYNMGNGSVFGLYEAAKALLDLSDISGAPSSSFDRFASV